MWGLMIKILPVKNSAYSSCREKFVNAFHHTALVRVGADGKKEFDSSHARENPCPALVFACLGCGKAEDDSGKKESAFAEAKRKRYCICQGQLTTQPRPEQSGAVSDLPPPYAVAPNRTETSLETPGSCMVTP